jgi:hypothetical protein
MFSRRSVTVLMFSRCLGATLPDTELPPQEPQPRVSDGSSLKLYRSPIAPWEEGVLISTRAVVICASKC